MRTRFCSNRFVLIRYYSWMGCTERDDFYRVIQDGAGAVGKGDLCLCGRPRGLSILFASSCVSTFFHARSWHVGVWYYWRIPFDRHLDPTTVAPD
jgi:hypothetical protein